MGYTRDKDFYTRGVGAIASADRNPARQYAARERARRTALRDSAMGRIATDTGGDGTATGQPAPGRPPGTSNPVVRPSPIKVQRVETTMFDGRAPKQPTRTGGFTPTPLGPRTSPGGDKTAGVVTTNGQVPPTVTGGGGKSGGQVVVDEQTGGNTGLVMAPLDLPELEAVSPSSPGMSTGTKIAIGVAAAAALYLIARRS